MKVFQNHAEVAEMIERDHQVECAKYNDNGTQTRTPPPPE